MQREAEEPSPPPTDELSETGSLTDMLQAVLSERQDPLAHVRRRQQLLFLRRRIFNGLAALQPSWDSDYFAHFRAEDFLVVLDRCASAGVEVFGVEAFQDDATYLDTNFEGLDSGKSHREFVKAFQDTSNISFCATFGVRDVDLKVEENADLEDDRQSHTKKADQETMQRSVTPELMAAYRATPYKIDDGGESFTLRVDEYSAPLAKLYERTGQCSALVITACNPYSEQQEEEKNLAAQQALRTDLVSGGARYLFAGVGEDPAGVWPGEPSCLVLGLAVEDARRLAAQYRQNAVLWAGKDAVPQLILLRSGRPG